MAERHQQQWTDKDRVAALALYEANGRKLRRTARDFGCAFSTLRLWVTGAPASVRDDARENAEDLAAIFERIARQALGLQGVGMDFIARDETGERAADQLSDLNRIAGTATEKVLLLRGEPTERIEHTVDLDLAHGD